MNMSTSSLFQAISGAMARRAILCACLVLVLHGNPNAHANIAIPTDVPYGRDVEEWWAKHPFNPKAASHDPDILSPVLRVSVPAGASINDAIAALPPSGGTLILAPGTYAPFTILRRSNIHILALNGALVTGTSRLQGTDLSYGDFAKAIRVSRSKTALDDFQNRKTTNIYVRGLTFDGGKSAVYALVSDCVTGVLVENCIIRNYIRHATVPNHVGMVIGCMGSNNIWYRGCRFECMRENPPGNALYHDGIHAGGLINCTIDSGFTSSGLLFLVNDDFTYDHDGDGTLEQNEIRRSEYVVIYGCQFAGGRHAVRMSGANSLIMNCRATGPYESAFAFFNPKTSLIYPDATYTYYGNCVIGNVVGPAGTLAEFTTGEDYCPPNQTNKGVVGRYRLRNNMTHKGGEMLRCTGPIEGPNDVRENTRE
jgi:hypothetical protein